MSTIKPSVGTDCAVNDVCDLDVRCENFQQCVVFETEHILLVQAPYTKAGPQVEWALGYIADNYRNPVSLTTDQFEDFTKKHGITWTEVPTGVEPKFQP